MPEFIHESFRVPKGKRLRLKSLETSIADPFADKDEAKLYTADCIKKIQNLQYQLFVEQKQSLLVVLQAPDAAGKDGLIRKVLGRVNPQGCTVHSFKVPTEIERSHDFLWRIHACTPAAGQIAIFNRSHYEDVLVVRVNDLVPKEIWQKRFDHINAFEENLADAKTTILKIYLNISRKEQLERFKSRLDEPDKHWKLNASDYQARDQHDDYRKAYEDVFARCNPDHAPWYIIPADNKWFRDAAVASLMLKTLQVMNPQIPSLQVNLDEIRKMYDQELAESETNASS